MSPNFRSRALKVAGTAATFALVAAGFVAPAASADQQVSPKEDAKQQRIAATSSTNCSLNPMGLATPTGSADNSAFTIFTHGDAYLSNAELEGSLAVGGKAGFGPENRTHDYPIYNNVAGNADYQLPTIDGDTTRVLLNQYAPHVQTASQQAGVNVKVYAQPANNPGFVKLVDTTTPKGYQFTPWGGASNTAFAPSPAIGAAHDDAQLISMAQPWNGGPASMTAKSSFTSYFSADPFAAIMEGMDRAGAWGTPKVSKPSNDASIELTAGKPNRVTLSDLRKAQVSGKFDLINESADTPLVIKVSDSDIVGGVLQLPTYMGAGNNDKGSSYILFDLADVSSTAPIEIKALAEERIRGSIYAPTANIVMGNPNTQFEGQIIANSFKMQGNQEIHTNLFYGRFPTGSIQLTKALVDPDGVVAEGTRFDFALTYGDQSQTVSLAAGETKTISCLPLGSTVTVKETTTSTNSDVTQTVSWEGGTATDDGVTLVASADASKAAARATNTYSKLGGFTLTKAVLGNATELVNDAEAEFTFAVTIDGKTQTVKLKDYQSKTFSGLPFGTKVTVKEVGATNIAHAGKTAEWAGVQYTDENDTVLQALSTDDSAYSFAIGPDTKNLKLWAENLYNLPSTGSFNLSKMVLVDGLDQVPNDYQFAFDVQYELPDGTSTDDSFTLQDDQSWDSPELPVGTKVTVTERSAEFPGMRWDPALTIQKNDSDSAQTVTGNSAQFVIDEKDVQLNVVMKNNYVGKLGSFELTKAVSGDTAGLPELEYSFAVDFQFPADDGAEYLPGENGNPAITLDGAPYTLGTAVTLKKDQTAKFAGVPAGTAITVTEADVKNPYGFNWDGVTFAVAGEATNAVSIPLTPQDPVAMVATNQFTDTLTDFTLLKTVEGPAGVDLSSLQFDFTVFVGTEQRGYTVKAGEPVTITDVPVGTVIRVREDRAPNHQAAAYSGVEYSVTGADWTVDDLGYATFTVDSGATQYAVNATNTYVPAGSFTLTKAVDGADAHSLADAKFTFALVYTDLEGNPLPLSLLSATTLKAGESVEVTGVPLGTKVNIFEEVTPELTDLTFAGVTYSGDGVTPIDGGAQITVADQQSSRFEVTATNKYVAKTGHFSIEKSVAGVADQALVADRQFPFAVTIDGKTETVYVSPTQPFTSGELPKGTTVSVRELTAPTILGYSFDSVKYSLNGQQLTGATKTSFTIGEGEWEYAVQAANTYREIPTGTFAIQKRVNGATTGQSTFPFLISYEAPANAVLPAGLPAIVNVSPTVGYTSPELPEGTKVTVKESSFVNVPGYDFAGVSYELFGKTIQSADAVEFTIGEDYDNDGEQEYGFEVIASNDYQEKERGSFTLTKVVDGIEDQAALADATFTFSVNYQAPAGQELPADLPSTLTVVNGVPQTVANLPQGTKVTLTESAPTSINGYAHTGVVYSVDGQVVAGTAAEFVIGDDNLNFAVTATNNYVAKQTGTFSISKTVEGINTRSAFPFVITYSVPEGESLPEGLPNPQTVEVLPTAGFQSVQLPEGTRVRISEGTVPAEQGATFEGVTYSVDGEPVSRTSRPEFTIGAEDDFGFEMSAVNHYSVNEGRFSLLKQVTGAEAEDAAFGFNITVDGVDWQPVYLRPGVLYTSPLIPEGAEVVITETEPTALTGYEWQGVTYTVGDSDSTTGPVVLNIAADQTLAVTATNSYQKLGDFTLAKSVSAPTGLVDSEAEYLFEVAINGEPLADPVAVGVDSPFRLGDLPIGTEVTISEVAPEPVDGVAWDGVVFSGSGISSDENGASFTISQETPSVQVTATNSFSDTREDVGAFSLTKLVAGAASEQEKHVFEVTIGDEPTQTIPLLAGQSHEFTEIPVGTEVLVQEINPPAITGSKWTSVSYIVDGSPAETQDLSTRFTVGENREVAIEATNNYVDDSQDAEFSLQKRVTGAVAGDTQFAFDVTINGETSRVTLKDGEVKTFTGLSRGAAIQVKEVVPGALAGTAFKQVLYAVDGTDLAVVDGSASFTLDESGSKLVATNVYQGTELPNTGGSMAAAFAAFGLLLLGLGAVALHRRYRS